MIDLHLHSNCSDGLDSPSQLVDKAHGLNRSKEPKIKAIAITDHDTINGVQEFISYGEDKDIIVIPGIEISIMHELDREIEDVHVVGLNFDHKAAILIKTLNKQMKGRLGQKKQICKRLREEFGYQISYEEVKSIAGNKVVGRPHIVDVMIKNNPDKVEGKTKNDLFKMISIGGIAYVDREFELTLEESIELINISGGIPILAHPGIYKVKDRAKFVEMCVDAGIKGIEIEYTYTKNRPFYNTERANWAQEFLPRYYRRIAEKFNLIKSGGSDYHGGKKNIKIGEANVPGNYLKKFI